MKNIYIAILGLLLCSCSHLSPLEKLKEEPQVSLLALTPSGIKSPPIGQNPAGFFDWTPAILFADLMKQMRTPWAQNSDYSNFLTDGVVIPTGADGWPSEVPFTAPNQPITQIVASGLYGPGGYFPTGIYTITFEGDGELNFHQMIQAVYTSGGKYTYNVTDTSGGLWLTIAKSNKNNPIRNIHIMMPGYDPVTNKDSFYQPYLALLRDTWGVIRMMGVQDVNFSPIKSWTDEKTVNSVTQTEHVAPLFVVELANQAHSDLWINVPHMADESWLIGMANTIKDHLAPNRKIYLEYSNEIWNWGFPPQRKWCQDQGLAQGLSTDLNIAAFGYQIKRSFEIAQVFKSILPDREIVKVIGMQAANLYLSKNMFTWMKDPKINPTKDQFDAMAIAPYFGSTVVDEVYAAHLDKTITPEQLVERAHLDIVNVQIPLMRDVKTLADENHIRLISYEAGNALMSFVPAQQQDPVFQNKLLLAQRLPAMGDAYKEYYRAWMSIVGDVVMNFVLLDTWSKYGSWGSMQNIGDTASPKFQALLQVNAEEMLKPLPDQVSGLFVEAKGGTQVMIQYQDVAYETGYVVLRDGEPLTYMARDKTVYSDTAIQPGKTYAYSVAAYNALGRGMVSEVKSVKIVKPGPLWSDLILFLGFDEGIGNQTLDLSASGLSPKVYSPLWIPIAQNCVYGPCLGFLPSPGGGIAIPELNYSPVKGMTFAANLFMTDSPSVLVFEKAWDDFDVYIEAGYAHCRIRNKSSQFFDIKSSTRLFPWKWSHVACVYDPISDEFKIYLNGLLESKLDLHGAFNGFYSSDTMFAGVANRPNLSQSSSFIAIDELAIWTRALSVQEILDHKSNGLRQLTCN